MQLLPPSVVTLTQLIHFETGLSEKQLVESCVCLPSGVAVVQDFHLIPQCMYNL